jgi:hypothetical protein
MTLDHAKTQYNKMKPKLEFESIKIDGQALTGFVKNCPENAQEYDQLAGRENASVDDGLDYTLFHNILTSFRDDVMKLAIARFGVEPKKEQKIDSEGKPLTVEGKPVMVITEKPVTYVARVIAEGKATFTDMQKVADDVCAGVAGDKSFPGYEMSVFLKTAVRGPKVPPKTFVETATTLKAQGPEKLSRALAKMRDTIGGDERLLDANASVEDIAWQIQRYNKAKTRELVDA